MKKLKLYGYFILLNLFCYNCNATDCLVDQNQMNFQIKHEESITVNGLRVVFVENAKQKPRYSHKCIANGIGGKPKESRRSLSLEWTVENWRTTLKEVKP